MKFAAPRLFAALGLLLAVVGCQNLDLTGETDPQRVVMGTVTLAATLPFPPDTEVVVRVVDVSPVDRPAAGAPELAGMDRARKEKIERVLGEHVIRAPGPQPIPFRIEFRADDATMRHGLNIDARITVGGKVTYRSLSAHVLTLGSVSYPHEVVVDLVR